MAAPLRSLGLRLLRKQQQAVLVYPGIGTYICKSKQLCPGSGAMFLQGSLSCSFDEIAIAPLSQIAKFVNKRTMHHLIGCPSISVKSPLFRKVHTPKCSLINCLPPTSKISQGAKPCHLIQKVSTSSGRSQSTYSKTEIGLDKSGAKDKYLDDLMLKIGRAILKRAEEKCIDWIVGSLGSGLFFVFCLWLSYVLGVDLRSKPDMASESPESKENQDALKALEDVLKHKDNRVLHYKKQVDTLLKLVENLLKLLESRSELTQELFDLVEKYQAALKEARESSEVDALKRQPLPVNAQKLH